MGRLGASITASVPRARPYRAEQSSGLFDVRAMGAAPMPMPPVPLHQRMIAQSPAIRYGQPFEADIPLIPGLQRRSRVPVERYGIGWFGVFVTWIMTVTLGCLLASNLTGHVRRSFLVNASAGTVAKPPAAPATPAPAAPAPPVAAAPVTGSASSPSAVTMATPPTAARTANPLPEVGIADLPRAPALTSAAPPRAHSRSAWRAPRRSAPAAAAPAADDDDADEAAPAAATPAPKPAPVAAKRVAAAADDDTSDSAPAPSPKVEAKAEPKAEPAPAPAPPKPAPKVTFAAGSLEDMIQKEVEKEQKKLHHK